MEKKKVIIHDLDDTINNLKHVACEFLADRYGIRKKDGTNFTAHDITNSDLAKSVPLPAYMNNNAYPFFIEMVKSGYYGRVEMREGVAEALKELSESYHNVIFTARDFGDPETRDGLRQGTYDELSRFGIDRHISMVLFSEDSARKIEFCRQNASSIFAIVEDRIETVNSVAGFGISSIVMDRPHNQGTLHHNAIRCYDWSDVPAIMKELKRENFLRNIA